MTPPEKTGPMVEQADEYAPIQAGPDARLSVWAVMSVMASLLVCCPVFTMVGPLLGWKALQEMKTASLRGKGLAQAGIAIGVITTAMSIGGYAWWQVNVRRPMLVGPQQALERGFAGDIAGFKSALAGKAAEQTDTEAAMFLSELSRRYGTFLGSAQDSTREAVGTVGSGLTIPYVLKFDAGSVRARAQFVTTSQSGFVGRFESIVIIDADRGHLAYPADAISLAGPDETTGGDPAAKQEPSADQ